MITLSPSKAYARMRVQVEEKELDAEKVQQAMSAIAAAQQADRAAQHLRRAQWHCCSAHCPHWSILDQLPTEPPEKRACSQTRYLCGGAVSKREF